MSHGGEPILSRRNELERGHVVSHGQEAGVVLPEVRAEEDLEAGAVDNIPVKAGIVVVNLETELEIRTLMAM